MAIKKISYEDIIVEPKITKSTKEVKPQPFFNGQERVERAFNIGLKVKGEGYNIFVAGPDGSGRTVYTKLKLEEIASKMEPPEDIVLETNHLIY